MSTQALQPCSSIPYFLDVLVINVITKYTIELPQRDTVTDSHAQTRLTSNILFCRDIFSNILFCPELAYLFSTSGHHFETFQV